MHFIYCNKHMIKIFEQCLNSRCRFSRIILFLLLYDRIEDDDVASDTETSKRVVLPQRFEAEVNEAVRSPRVSTAAHTPLLT